MTRDGGSRSTVGRSWPATAAAARWVVAEVDVPGHVNAALSSYPELNCDGRAPRLYTGTSVGFTSLCLDKPVTYRFLDDVIGELAALTPGPYLHVGGDEAKTVPGDRYASLQGVPGHEVRRRYQAGARVGRACRGARRLRLGPGEAA